MVQLMYDDAMEAIDGGGCDGFVTVAIVNMDSRRWESYHQLILKRLIDGTFWAAQYSEGLTENQESMWFGHGHRAPEGTLVKFDQVWPKQIATTVYVSQAPHPRYGHDAPRMDVD